jgi:hypothetical protein
MTSWAKQIFWRSPVAKLIGVPSIAKVCPAQLRVPVMLRPRTAYNVAPYAKIMPMRLAVWGCNTLLEICSDDVRRVDLFQNPSMIGSITWSARLPLGRSTPSCR